MKIIDMYAADVSEIGVLLSLDSQEGNMQYRGRYTPDRVFRSIVAYLHYAQTTPIVRQVPPRRPLVPGLTVR